MPQKKSARMPERRRLSATARVGFERAPLRSHRCGGRERATPSSPPEAVRRQRRRRMGASSKSYHPITHSLGERLAFERGQRRRGRDLLVVHRVVVPAARLQLLRRLLALFPILCRRRRTLRSETFLITIWAWSSPDFSVSQSLANTARLRTPAGSPAYSRHSHAAPSPSAGNLFLYAFASESASLNCTMSVNRESKMQTCVQ